MACSLDTEHVSCGDFRQRRPHRRCRQSLDSTCVPLGQHAHPTRSAWMESHRVKARNERCTRSLSELSIDIGLQAKMRRVKPRNPIYYNERAAREYLESLRWPDGPVCPRCGASKEAAPMRGRSTRPGVWKCRKCRKPFTCTIGTVCERSKIGLSKWLLALYFIQVSARGLSARQLHIRLGVSYKTALYMMRRIRGGAVERARRIAPSILVRDQEARRTP